MSLFSLNVFRRSEDLTPPKLRSNTITAMLRVLLRPLKWCEDLFFKEFCKGTTAGWYNSGTTYSKYNRVIWQDGAVYQLMVNSSVGIDPTGNALSATNWLKVLDNFIGIDERVRYNGQRIVFEYAINKWFNVTSAPYIYLETPTLGGTSSVCVIYVPVAVWTALGTNTTSRNNRVKQFARKYVPAGYLITIYTY